MSDDLKIDEINEAIETEQKGEGDLPKGFITKEEWIAKGRDPDEWRDPDEFKKRGDEILPIVKKERDELREEIKHLKGDIDKIISFNNRQEKRLRDEGYKQALKDIEAKRDEAIEDGDKETVKKLDKDRDEIIKAQNKPEEQPQGEPSPDFIEFKKRNPWYQSDTELTKYADSEAMVGMFQGMLSAGKSAKEAFAEVEELVKLKFANKFENKNRDLPPEVEGDANTRTKKTNGKLIDSIKDANERKAARESFERIKKNFALKNIKYTEAEYMQDY